jgi:hypothetical protein
MRGMNILRFCKALRVATTLVLCGGALGTAWAWGPKGHATVAAIAERLVVGTRAEAEVTRLLKAEGVSLHEAAVWADCVKAVQHEDGNFVYADPGKYADCKPFETPEGMAHAVAYVQANWQACKPQFGQDPCHKQYHYTDVSLQHARYSRRWVGTSDHDLVAALQACIAVLQGRPAPAPFHFNNRTEALLLLTHLVGDVHQPLHVGAIYLDAKGRRVNPDAGHHDPHTDTVGGNRIDDGHGPLHRAWDDLPARLGPQGLGEDGVDDARAVPAMPGPLADWPLRWANDTLKSSRSAFDGMTFSAASGKPPHWQASLPEGYAERREALQREQLLKAGARLAQLLRAIFPG